MTDIKKSVKSLQEDRFARVNQTDIAICGRRHCLHATLRLHERLTDFFNLLLGYSFNTVLKPVEKSYP